MNDKGNALLFEIINFEILYLYSLRKLGFLPRSGGYQMKGMSKSMNLASCPEPVEVSPCVVGY